MKSLMLKSFISAQKCLCWAAGATFSVKTTVAFRNVQWMQHLHSAVSVLFICVGHSVYLLLTFYSVRYKQAECECMNQPCLHARLLKHQGHSDPVPSQSFTTFVSQSRALLKVTSKSLQLDLSYNREAISKLRLVASDK